MTMVPTGASDSYKVPDFLDWARSTEIFERAQKLIPGGVNSPVRSFSAVGCHPLVVASGSGAYVTSVDGKRYLDFVQSWGASLFGHAWPPVVEAACKAAASGTSFGMLTEAEVELARKIVEMWPSIEKVRLVSSGTEATMSAVRLARAFTGRDLVVKFEGCYHGHSDVLLAKAGSGVATLGLPGSAGVPQGAVSGTVVLPYNDSEAVEELFLRDGERIAAVIVEPVAANMGVVPPAPGFLDTLRRVTETHGALLIFDEVITGFRVGSDGVQGREKIYADITTLGKVLGGGFPLAAFGGKAEIMDGLAPEGPVYQAGTLSGNPVAVAAALAVLDNIDETVYRRLEGRVAYLARELQVIFEDAGLEASVSTYSSLMSVFFRRDVPRNYTEAAGADKELYGAFFRALIRRGVLFPPSFMETAFVSLAHERDDLERTIEICESAAHEVARGRVGTRD
jgi:glutamate-1-semialdehyde 2,1-aminomutase